VQVSEWKKLMSEGATRVFEGGQARAEAEDFEAERSKLCHDPDRFDPTN
jgi:hypothetical protein